LVGSASLSYTDPSDYSGCNTIYYVDQEQLMKNIQVELEFEELDELLGRP
jgi:hypothetical protein